jgi:hypothetical protein
VSVKHAGKYTMQGEYEILENGDIFLSYQLIDLNYKVINRNSIVIAKAAHPICFLSYCKINPSNSSITRYR